MGYSGGLVTAPVGMGDISSAVHYSSLDLGTLITNGTINPGAKYKPVAYDNWGILTEAQRQAHNCGLSMVGYNSLNALWAAAMNMSPGVLAWHYERPRGVSGVIKENFRILDFDGYDENSVFAFQYSVKPNPTSSSTVVITNEDIMLTARCIEKSDLKGNGDAAPHGTYLNISNYNLAVAIAESTASGPQWVKTFAGSDIPLTITLPNAGASNKTYKIVMFFTNQTFNGETTNKSGNYVLSAYPLISVQYIATNSVVASGVMNSARTSIAVTIRAASAAFTVDHLAIRWSEGGTMQEKTIPRTSGITITTTDATYSVGNNDGWAAGTEFYLRVYTTASAYQDYILIVMQS